MSKKITILDELNIKGGGIYCLMPFERLDQYKKAVFKIGSAINFRSRLEQYHTYFNQGVYMCAFLENPPVPKFLRSKEKQTPTKQHYLAIEKFVLNYIQEKGGKIIHSSTRVNNPNELKEGRTEWVYTNQNIIHQAFQEANKQFSGKLSLYNLDDINKTARANESSKKPKYTGKIIFLF